MAPSKWLGFYGERFATVELNNAFYRLPEGSSFEKWHDGTPSDFVFAVKASRYLTHVRRLRDPAQPVDTLMERAIGLKSRMGPVLLQLPPNLKADPPALDETLAAFHGRARVAVEARHASWFTDEFGAVLESHNAALCLVDGGPVDVPKWRTTKWSYVRFHRGKGTPAPCYSRAALNTWAKELSTRWERSEDVFCYFNNDPNCCAIRDARRLAQAFARHGRTATRVPEEGEVRVG
jgi:uncharacterized protein YecE (DUF72 family)